MQKRQQQKPLFYRQDSDVNRNARATKYIPCYKVRKGNRKWHYFQY